MKNLNKNKTKTSLQKSVNIINHDTLPQIIINNVIQVEHTSSVSSITRFVVDRRAATTGG